jgi:tetratricopeptide (TPR) repeat protein
MERKRYYLITLIMICNLVLTGQNNYKPAIYKAYITGNMGSWSKALEEMESQKNRSIDYLLELINYQYGYIGWCISNKNDKEAEHYISKMESNLEDLRSVTGESSEFHSYKAALYGFKLGMNIWKAPVLGKKSMTHAKMAIEKDSMSLHANFEMGNIWNYMPELFGGSKLKALQYYIKAISILENEKSGIKNNWNYLNLLVLAGQAAKELGNIQKAIYYFEKALETEPDFIWVKNELLPSLKTEQ